MDERGALGRRLLSRRTFLKLGGTGFAGAALLSVASSNAAAASRGGQVRVPRFGVFERRFDHAGDPGNPYRSIRATATFVPSSGRGKRTIPLFWDGGTAWKVRFSPDVGGAWSWSVESNDQGLDGRRGVFVCTASRGRGGIRAMSRYPHHFAYQDGSPFWWMGDTNWNAFSDIPSKNLDRAAVEHYVDVRGSQGFNVVSVNLLGFGLDNEGGLSFHSLQDETLNPVYFRASDVRLRYMNRNGITPLLFLTWGGPKKLNDEGINGDNETTSPAVYGWQEFPDDEARRRYARYVVGRYSAYNVAFCVSGEYNVWPDSVKEFEALGRLIGNTDPHGRLIGIHPGSGGLFGPYEDSNSVEAEFADEPWMSFGDFKQDYTDLHRDMLRSRDHDKPVVNGEYAYYLRDQDGNGEVDKDNSATIADIRHATWDIAMAGGYFVTGFGTTYHGGIRARRFDVDDPRNDDWEAQIQHVRNLFTRLEWWKLQPRDGLISANVGRDSSDSGNPVPPSVQTDGGYTRPPLTTYWTLAEVGRQYVTYVRGVDGELRLSLGQEGPKESTYEIRLFDPRTGEHRSLDSYRGFGPITLDPPDTRDWVFVVIRKGRNRPPRG